MADKGYKVISKHPYEFRGSGLITSIPNEITPMAWKNPPLNKRSEGLKEPRSDAGATMPCTRMVKTITTIPTSANVLALANYTGC